MLKVAIPAVAAFTLFALCLTGAEPLRTFSGVVTDTMCGSKPHSNMLKDKTAAECARQCARGPYGYALFDGTAVMKLSDQKTAAAFAGQEVTVTGVYDGKSKTLKVAKIESGHGN
ncbi:MAG TPA: hypothetical protein VHY84_07715 [Bryobacteraceae bacterium]|jgi:hypothetical protein|nr:hypothetical protein [Bryobacteraceae bacterium]